MLSLLGSVEARRNQDSQKTSPVNTRELSLMKDWDEDELQRLVTRFVRTFRRFPSYDELVRFRHARGQLHLRRPAQGPRGFLPAM